MNIFILVLKIGFIAIAVLAVGKYLFSKKTRKDNPNGPEGLDGLNDIL